MRLRALLVLLVPCLSGQVSTQPWPEIPASLSVFAGAGDLTYCVTVPVRGALPAFTLTCRRAGATYLTLSTLKSSGVFSSGDVTWAYNWDRVNPRLVHVQASASTRDASVLSAALAFAGLTGEFTLGESVHDAGNSKGGTVLHWIHSSGTVVNDGVSTASFGAQIALNNLVGTWAPGDQVIGASGTGIIAVISPVTGMATKTAFDAEWPAAAPSLLGRAWRTLTGR